MDDQEQERRIQISVRLKAARWLAGGPNSKGKPAPLGQKELALLPESRDAKITVNLVQETEQTTNVMSRQQLEAIEQALNLPNWFSGLHYADRGEAISESLGAVLQAVAEGARAHRLGPAGVRSVSGAEGPSGQGGATGA